MDGVVHFEIPHEDRERATKFYESVFGWQMQKLGEEMGNYVLVTTTETDEKGPKKPGMINGGLFQKNPEGPIQSTSLVIAVNDLKESAKKLIESGGKVLGETMEIPGVGMYAPFIDTEGNCASMLQPIPVNWHAPKND